WDAHKMMLLPLSAGLLLARDEADLDRAFAQDAPYLFHRGAGGRTVDQGVRSFQCSRRSDAIKLWVALQRYGANGIGRLYERLCDLAHHLWEAVRAHERFEPLHQPESNILAFRYLGPADAQLAPDRIDQFNWQLRESYNASGGGWITSTMLGGRRVL